MLLVRTLATYHQKHLTLVPKPKPLNECRKHIVCMTHYAKAISACMVRNFPAAKNLLFNRVHAVQEEEYELELLVREEEYTHHAYTEIQNERTHIVDGLCRSMLG